MIQFHLVTCALGRRAPYRGPLLFKRGLMRTNIYVDGFNLYYGCLKGTPYKWLDPVKLFQTILAENNKIHKVHYFTARVRPAPDDTDVHVRQDVYFRALQHHCPDVQLHFGHFLRHKVYMPLAKPDALGVSTARVIKTEEKGSDVNLSVHLLNDAWLDAYDCAVVVSNDSDIAESMRLIREHHPQKILGLMTPGLDRRTSEQLGKHAHFIRKIRASALAAAQMPDSISGTKLHKPLHW